MPHKRAKLSARVADSAQKGYNLAPSSRSGDTPRQAARVLNAFSTRAAFKASGRVSSEDTGEDRRPKKKGQVKGAQGGGPHAAGSSTKAGGVSQPGKEIKDKGKGKEKGPEVPKILPHETLGEYNRRVESILRPGVSAAIKGAAAASRKGHQSAPTKAATETDVGADDGEFKFEDREVKTFAEASMRKRVRDVAEAPPSLPRLRQAQVKSWAAPTEKVEKGARKDAYKVTGRTPLSAGQARIMAEERERVVKMYREMKAKKEAEKAAERLEKGSGGGAGGDGKGKKKRVREE